MVKRMSIELIDLIHEVSVKIIVEPNSIIIMTNFTFKSE